MTERTDVSLWDRFFEPARLFLELPDFEDMERGYKLKIAAAVGELSDAVRSDSDVQTALGQALRFKGNNLLSWQLVDTYLKWTEAEPSAALSGLAAVFDESASTEAALAGFLTELPKSVVSGTGSRLSIASFHLMGRGEPEQTPPYRWQVVQTVKEMASWSSDPASDEEEYFDTVRMFDSFAVAAREAGLAVESPLHAQGLLYAIAKWKPSEEWSPELRNAVAAVRRQKPSQSLSLPKALAQYDRAAAGERLQAAADQRADFVNRFAANVWPEVSIETYSLGLPGSKDSVSYALEYSTVDCGSIRGGSANKYLLYFSSAQDSFKFESKYASQSEAWEAIRKGVADLVNLAASGDFAEIDKIDALWAGPAMRTKLAWMYFPDQLLPVYAESHLDYWLSIFGVPAGKLGRVEKNRLLFDTVTGMPEFEGWQTLEIMHFLYSWSDPNPDRKIVKIAPGRDGFLWDDCLENGTIRLGWDGTGDLSQFDNDDELRAHYETVNPEENKSLTTRTVRVLKTFRDLEEGDLIVANRGTKKVLGIGRVTAGYRFEPDFDVYRHVVDVDWFDTTERDIDFGSKWRSTLVPVKADDYHRILQQDSSGEQTLPAALPPAVPPVHREAERLLDRSGQLIFYGPPGTGKTFTARRHAVWLLHGGSADDQAAHAFGSSSTLHEMEGELLKAQASDERPSWVVVANPSYWSFDELFEKGSEVYDYGRLQRNYDDVQVGDTVFGYEATPMKKIVATATISRSLYLGGTGKQHIDIEAGTRPPRTVSWEELNSDPILASSEPVASRMQGTLFRLEPHEAARLRELTGLDDDAETHAAGVARLTRVTFHPTYAYEDFIEGYKPSESGNGGLELRMKDGVFKQVCRAAAADPDNPYVIMIDEINRGNVPKVFGELITLIEKDKRGMTLTLPQSGQSFHVPPNLHIIATMNTADRSVHVLDAALRRRFAFVELMPEPDLLESKVGPMPLDDFLASLNTKIRASIGRERQVGHAVLMDKGEAISTAVDFALAFKYELLPLLQEYTYGNYNDLAELLGPEVIDEERQTPRLDIIEDPERLVEALAKHLEIG